MYKDKDKQREANVERQRRYKAKQKALLSEGVTDKALSEQEFIEEAAKIFNVPTGSKRGKAIKCFADLPADIQMTINRMSGHDKAEHQRRTAIAVAYQHTFGEDIQYL